MLRKCVVGTLCLLVVLSTACSGTPTVAPSNTPDRTAQAYETSEAATQQENEARATAAQATEEAEQLAATDQAATQVHLTEEAAAKEATQEAATVQTVTAATVQAEPMLDLVQQLHADGYISGTDGTYFTLPDFDESWAQVNTYLPNYTGFSSTDFVIEAEASWDSASDTTNWRKSGCGFVFREDGVDHYLAYLGLDGRVYFYRNVNNVYAALGSSYYGKLDTHEGHAQIMLVVEGINITFFVDGEKVHTRQDQGLASGNLALTLLSGTNTGFGTRCRMVNIELWELK
jgi:hypothetical protein